MFQLATEEERSAGRWWPTSALSMIGEKRMNNIQFCVEDAIRNGIDGDLIETGVWRGGAVIFMRAILKANSISNRTVWVADSFEGLPKPNEEKYPADAGDRHYLVPDLAISLEQVQENFRNYELLDDQVKFLKGWFKDTLPGAPISKIAVARLDGDLYESTMDALTGLYPKVSVGGYVIIDDYHVVPACKKAVQDFIGVRKIEAQIQEIDGMGVFWQRQR